MIPCFKDYLSVGPLYTIKPLKMSGKYRILSNCYSERILVEHKIFFGLGSKWVPEEDILFCEQNKNGDLVPVE